MQLSKNDFRVVDFLIRNFDKKYTMRNIALSLKLSPAGVYSSLKKLERQGIVSHEKLGTGLFYAINFGNKIAEHIAAVCLLDRDVKDITKNITGADAAVFDGKNLLLISEMEASCSLNVNVIVRNKSAIDTEALEIIRNGKVLFGESIIMDIIKGKK